MARRSTSILIAVAAAPLGASAQWTPCSGLPGVGRELCGALEAARTLLAPQPLAEGLPVLPPAIFGIFWAVLWARRPSIARPCATLLAVAAALAVARVALPLGFALIGMVAQWRDAAFGFIAALLMIPTLLLNGCLAVAASRLLHRTSPPAPPARPGAP